MPEDNDAAGSEAGTPPVGPRYMMAFVIPGHTPDRQKVRSVLRRLMRSGICQRIAWVDGPCFVASPDMSPLEDGYLLYYDTFPGAQQPSLRSIREAEWRVANR